MDFNEVKGRASPARPFWLIVRVERFRIHFFTRDPSKWTRDLSAAWFYVAKPDAYEDRAKLGGLVVIFDGYPLVYGPLLEGVP